MTHHKHPLRWLIWCLAAFFYFYEFVLRVSPNIMAEDWMSSFGIGAAGVSVLSACYLFSYAPMQIPVGALIDRYGVKKLLSGASLICGGGALIFSLVSSLTVAAVGRTLIGAGSAFAFVSMVYITTHWFSPKRRAFLIGLANSIALLGASAGGGPLSMMVQHLGWRASVFILGAFGILLAGGIYWTLRNDKGDDRIEGEGRKQAIDMWKSLKTVVSNRRSWINAVVAGCFYITTTVLGGLWGSSFVKTAYGVSEVVAGYAVSMVFIGWVAGGPIIGYISDRLGRRISIVRIAMLVTALLLAAVIYCNSMPIWALFILTFLVGLFSSAELLNFSISIDVNPFFVKATALAFTNFVVSMADLISQPLTGFLLELKWAGKMIDSAQVYTLSDYQSALSFLPVAIVVGVLISLTLRDQVGTEGQ